MNLFSLSATLLSTFIITTPTDYVGASSIRGRAAGEQESRSLVELDYLQNIMNDMSIYFGDSSGENYNPNFVSALKDCLSKWDQAGDPSLQLAADEQWRQTVSYAQHPNVHDPWVNCIDEPNHDRCTSSDFSEGQEDMAALFGTGTTREMVIEEPCNYSSNMAYYHAALRICDRNDWSGGDSNLAIRQALKQSFVTLASGSAFWHGSRTDLGKIADNLPIGIIAYISYESLVDAIGGSTRLRCLGPASCARSEDVARQATFASLDFSLSLEDGTDKTEWHNELIRIEDSFPSTYELTFAATIVIVVYICFPEVAADFIVSNIAFAFDDEAFLDDMVSEVKPLINNLGITDWQKPELIGKFIGGISKISMAFVFQEAILFDADFNPTQLAFGIAGAEKIFEFGDFLVGNDQTAFPYADGDYGAYPGWGHCNTRSAHALWHELSAEGLSELNFLVDSLITIIENQCPAAGSLEGCPSGQYCKWTGTHNECVGLKSTGETCSKDLVCASNDCSSLYFCNECPSAGSRNGCPSGEYCKWSGTNNKCVELKGTGETCSKDLVCDSNDCSSLYFCNECPSAGSRNGCPSGEYCKWSGTNNKCVGLKPRYGTCTSGTVCQSGRCRWGLCTKP